MPPKDLRHFLELLETRGELRRIAQPVSADRELTEITERFAHSPEQNTALLFERTAGGAAPVVTNLLGSESRICLALGVEHVDEIARRIERVVNPVPPSGAWASLDRAFGMAEIARYTGRVADRFTLNLDPAERTFAAWPIPRNWPDEIFPSIAGALFAYDDSGRPLAVSCRLHVAGETEGLITWPAGPPAGLLGRPTADAVFAIGCDPALTIALAAPLPPAIDAIQAAGWLRRERFELIRSKTVDAPFPARTEICFEGRLDLTGERSAGLVADPFGRLQPESGPTFTLLAVNHRPSALVPALLPVRPPNEASRLARAIDRVSLPIARLLVSGLVDLSRPIEGAGRLLAISIHKRSAGQGRRAIQAIWGSGLFRDATWTVVVDADIDVQHLPEVLARWWQRVDPRRDSLSFDGLTEGSLVGFDATRKLAGEGGQPADATMTPAVRDRIDSLWSAFF